MCIAPPILLGAAFRKLGASGPPITRFRAFPLDDVLGLVTPEVTHGDSWNIHARYHAATVVRPVPQ